MIHLITSRPSKYNDEDLNKTGAKISKGKDFLFWLNSYTGRTQLDTETNVVRDIFGYERKRNGKNGWGDLILNQFNMPIPIERKCYVIQIGDEEGNDQWVFDMEGLDTAKLDAVKVYLKSDLVKVAHNAIFEYTVIKWNFGIDIKNVRDTYLMSRILHTGRNTEKGFHSMAGCASRLLNLDLSKSAQTTFTTDPLSMEQLLYAATDVAPLIRIHDILQKDIDKWGMENVVRLECALIRPYGDAMCDNFYFDKEKWRANMHMQERELEESRINLYDIIRTDFYDKAIEYNFIQAEDHYRFGWGSPKQKKALMKIAYPNLEDDCTTIPKYKKYLKDLHQQIEDGVSNLDPSILEFFLNRDFNKVEELFINNYKVELDELGIFTKKGTMLINFNSPEQMLKLFQLIKPNIENSNKETLAKINHPLAREFNKFSKCSKLVTSYGENFIDAVSPDGKLRIPKVSQILDTGRTSLGLYQLLPLLKGQSLEI